MAKELHEVIEEINQEEEQQQEMPFMVNDKESAAEALRRIAYHQERIEEHNRIVENQIKPFLDKIEKIKEWGRQATKDNVERIQYYEALLEMYMKEEVEKQIASGKAKPKKSINLPFGKIALKKQQPIFEQEEEQLLEYAKSVGMVKVTESTNWSELKKKCQVVNGSLVDEDGVVVPGIRVTERPDKFELKLD